MRSLLRSYLAFLRDHKWYWLAPLIAVVLLLILVALTTDRGAVAPIIYTGG